MAMSSSNPSALGKPPSDAQEAIHNPGTVKIDVRGAYIVDDEPQGIKRIGNKDIRLPHHTGVVSHVAVDVSVAL